MLGDVSIPKRACNLERKDLYGTLLRVDVTLHEANVSCTETLLLWFFFLSSKKMEQNVQSLSLSERVRKYLVGSGGFFLFWSQFTDRIYRPLYSDILLRQHFLLLLSPPLKSYRPFAETVWVQETIERHQKKSSYKLGRCKPRLW